MIKDEKKITSKKPVTSNGLSSVNLGKHYTNDLNKNSLKKHIATNWQLYAFMLIPLTYYLVFRYIPMIGNIIAF